MFMDKKKVLSSEKVLLVLNQREIMTKDEIFDEITEDVAFNRFYFLEFNNKSVCSCDDMIFYMNECYKENSTESQMSFIATISIFGFIVTISLTCNAFKHKDQIKKFFGRLTKKKQRRLFRRVNRIVVME
jgi:hypothetical protein